MVRHRIAALHVDELHARAPGKKIADRGAVAVAAMVRHGRSEGSVGRDAPLHLTGQQIETGRIIGAEAGATLPQPDQIVVDKHVHRPTKRFTARSGPQRLAGAGRISHQAAREALGLHRGQPLAQTPVDLLRISESVGAQQHVALDDQRGRRPARTPAGHLPRGVPKLGALLRIDTNHGRGILPEHAVAPRRQRHGKWLDLRSLPAHVPGGGLDGHHRFHGWLGRCDLRQLPQWPRGVSIDRRRNDQVKRAVAAEDFVRPLGAGVGCQRLTGGCIQGRHRRVEAERHVHPVANRHQPTRELYRTGAEYAQVRLPTGDGPSPQQQAVKGITSHQFPLRRKGDGGPRRFVADVKQAARCRHCHAHTRQGIVVASDARRVKPLQMLRRPHHRIPRYRIVAGVVQRVRPIVDCIASRFDRAAPAAVAADAGRAAGRQHAEHFLHRQPMQVLRHEEVHQIINIRKTVAAEEFHRNVAVKPQRLDITACGRRRSGVEGQPVNSVSIACPQCNGELAAGAAEVDDQSPLHASNNLANGPYRGP